METGSYFSQTLISTLKKTQEKHGRYVQMCKNAEWITRIPICDKYLRETDKTTNESTGDLREQEDEGTFKSCCSNSRGAIPLLLVTGLSGVTLFPEPPACSTFSSCGAGTHSVTRSPCVLSFYVGRFVLIVSSFLVL